MIFLYFLVVNFLLFTEPIFSFNPIGKSTLYNGSLNKRNKELKGDLLLNELNKKLEENDSTSNILFFTSVSNFVPSFVYDNFLKKLSEKYQNKLLVPKKKEDIKKLDIQDDSLTIIAHASGAIESLKYAKNKKVKKLVLIDPVDNRIENIKNKKITSLDSFWDDENDPLFDLKNIEKVLFLYTQKSYKWEDENSLFGWVYNPFSGFNTFWPSFIPEKLSIKPKDLITSEYKCESDDCDDIECRCDPEDSKLALKILNYGLCDILDYDYSNFIHNTICEGHPDRSEENIDSYHSKIALIINLFLKHQFNDYKEFLDDLEDISVITK